MDLEKEILILTLENAIQYNGQAQAGAIIGKILGKDPKLKKKIKDIKKIIDETVDKVNSLDIEQQKQELENLGAKIEKKKIEKSVLPELRNTKDLVMRFAPYPSGPLHLGNTKQLILNDEYVKKYKGRLLLVFDDTIGSGEKTISKEAYDLILEGVKWLNCKISKIYYKSDRLKIYYKYAKELIKKDKAYVCFCDSRTLRENREKGIECKCRKNSIKINLKEFGNMLNKKYDEGRVTLRLKTNMKHKNPAFRDRVLFRISNREHPRTKNKYVVWPLLEFSWAIDDHLLKMTHILRGKDLMMESEMEEYIWDIFKWKHPEIIHTGLITIEGIKLSKSKSKKEVEIGKYSGWHDPRTWSLQSLVYRGILAQAIRNFILNTGLTQNDITVPIDNLYSENRKLIEEASNRYFFIDDPVMIKIEKSPKKEIEINLHPDFPEKGSRKFETSDKFYITKNDFNELKDNRLYRLMECLNFTKLKNKFIFHSSEYKIFKEKGEKIIHWLPYEKDLVNVEVVMPNGIVKKGFGEKILEKTKLGTILQFERFGFCCLNKIEKEKLIFYFTHR